MQASVLDSHYNLDTTQSLRFSWAFPESYTADGSWIVRSSGRTMGETKGLIYNSTIKVSFRAIIIRLCHCMIAITRL